MEINCLYFEGESFMALIKKIVTAAAYGTVLLLLAACGAQQDGFYYRGYCVIDDSARQTTCYNQLGQVASVYNF